MRDGQFKLAIPELPNEVVLDPYPHLVVNNFLPKALYQKLAEHYPSDASIIGKTKSRSNERRQISAAALLRDSGVTMEWNSFIEFFVSQGWWEAVLGVFTEAIRKEHSLIESTVGKPLGEFSVGVRGLDKADLVLDCQPGINTPALKRSTVRGPHVDNPVELFGGLLYFRLPEDDSEGGDLLLYKHRKSNPLFWGKAELREKDVEVVKRVPYASNTLVLFVNSINAVHGVSPRMKTKHSRRLINIIGEVYEGGGLFNLPRDRSYLGRVQNRWYQYRYGW